MAKFDRQLARFHTELTAFIQAVFEASPLGPQVAELYSAGVARLRLVFDEREPENVRLVVTFASGDEVPLFWQSSQSSRAQPALDEAIRILQEARQ